MGAIAELYVERREPAAATLTFEARSLGEPRRLEVRAGATVLGTFVVDDKGETQVRVPLPAGRGATPLILRSLDGAATPEELGLAEDDRPLSVALSDVRLETTPAPTRPTHGA